MNRKISTFFLGIILLAACTAVGTSASAAPTDLLPFEDLTPGELRGFGDSWNRYAWSMAEHEGDLYVGTWNQKFRAWRLLLNIALYFPNFNFEDLNLIFQMGLGGFPVSASKGGEIWKYDTTAGEWGCLVTGGYDSPLNTGYRAAAVYKDAVYFGSANYFKAPQLIRISQGGDVIEQIRPEPAGWRRLWERNNSIRGMTVYYDTLYIGTENQLGGELWRYDAENGLERVRAFEEISVAELCVYDGYLFAGMWDWEKGVRLYRMSAMDFEAVDMTPPELLDSNNLGIMSLGVFQGSLFAGTVNYQDGFTLIRYDSPNATEDGPVDYSLLTTNGFGYPDNGYVWRMQVFDYALFLGVFNSGNAESPPHDGRAQLWYSTDGEIFLPLVTDGFDDPWDEGVRTMAAWNDRLCVGTASSIPRSVFPGTPGGLRILVSQPAP